MKRAAQTGFTLIEMIITVLIVSVLAAIALPAYQSMVVKSNRTEARAMLSDTAQRLQRCFSSYGRYNSANCGVYEKVKAVDGVISEGAGFYKITFASVAATQFQLKAEAIKTPQLNDDPCKEMFLASTGERTPAACW